MTLYDLILGCLIFAASAHFISIAVLLVRPYVRRPLVPEKRPPVTILRPATGLENNIEETLASAFAIDYRNSRSSSVCKIRPTRSSR
jgi:cellulose synthase/poly-beta-1,6-N-acetylglucosamine synthase-like glycosyltransferase